FVLLPFSSSFLITHPPLFTIFPNPPSFYLVIPTRFMIEPISLSIILLPLSIFLRNGYKMCIRAYLNGDGSGYKTHFSVFFVLMRGEFDPLLKWPFEYKVSLILVDQDQRKHVVQTFKPTAESSSFKRPTSDMNVASGWVGYLPPPLIVPLL
ncbi:TNF receptor-associated factor 2, partial [Geodia barretti]